MPEEHGLPAYLSREDTIARLKELAALKTGEPFPWWMSGANNWGVVMSDLARCAVHYLEQDKDDHGAGTERLE